MTTLELAKITDLAQRGFSDGQIGQMMHYDGSTISQTRRQHNIPTNYVRCRYNVRLVDTKTGDIVAEGTVNECAKKLFVSASTIYMAIARQGTILWRYRAEKIPKPKPSLDPKPHRIRLNEKKGAKRNG